MSRVGRKTKLTPAAQQVILQALSVGATKKLACTGDKGLVEAMVQARPDG